jgi:hypothetical protein
VGYRKEVRAREPLCVFPWLLQANIVIRFANDIIPLLVTCLPSKERFQYVRLVS